MAAKAFAIGIGDISSAGVCVYGENNNLNDECPSSCEYLITATWGECYCRNPNYKPDTIDTDEILSNFSVFSIFKFIHGSDKYGKKYNATCRTWISKESQMKKWNCQ